LAARPTNSIASSALARAAATWRSRRKAPVMTFGHLKPSPEALRAALREIRAIMIPTAPVSYLQRLSGFFTGNMLFDSTAPADAA
jgi:hypothetical protein